MKYTQEIIAKITSDYQNGMSAGEIARALSNEVNGIVPEKSVIAKLANLGIYKRKEYVNKRGQAPIKKEEYIERIANLLDINVDLMESLEKVTKTALILMERQITALRER